ncbi:SGNH/GDSL hydrolase family protein [Streptomyces javensis]|uniref:SGNH/GDSL hydrolase family protein n=1 Tax=Streptomyces javensis TaxID=114698 RepID=A0ABS0RFQ0_9ACTN|nr:SGNH/GDSL hydrolase family protein [Streptomyces javensis]MBI0316241.1 SGNH/GDSL hydrolase family protein [Streptomyces javensis]
MQRPGLSARALGLLAATAAALGAFVATGTESYAAQSAAQPTPPPAPRSSVVTWASSAYPAGTAAQDLTYRFVVHTSVGGRDLRIRLSNAYGDQPVTFGHAYAGVRDSGAAVVPGSNGRLTFRGASSVTVPAGGVVYSDPLPGRVQPQSDLAISLYVRSAGTLATGHKGARATQYVAPAGDHAAEEGAAAYSQAITSWYYLDAAVVRPPRGTGAVVAFGDSITDGSASTQDTNRRWPDFLAGRLLADPRSRLKGVANEGISGNRVLADGSAESALKRLDRDVLSQAGVRTTILLEGINDIKATPGPTADDLIAGYREIIARSHARGTCVVGATVMPYEGWREYEAVDEAVRQQVNAFIRTSGEFDAVVDFDKAVRDPAAPTRMLPAYDGGDHLHPNDTGMRVMSDAIPLRALNCDR